MTSSVSPQPTVDAKLKLYYVPAPRQVTLYVFSYFCI